MEIRKERKDKMTERKRREEKHNGDKGVGRNIDKY
jgi:hypothetical protein